MSSKGKSLFVRKKQILLNRLRTNGNPTINVHEVPAQESGPLDVKKRFTGQKRPKVADIEDHKPCS